MTDDIQQFLSPFSPQVRELAWKLRALILGVMPNTIEQLDPPAKLIGYGVDRTYKGLICGITLHRAHVNLMFARGAELPDPDKLLTGTGKRARHIRIEHPGDIDRPGVRALLEAALAMHRG